MPVHGWHGVNSFLDVEPGHTSQISEASPVATFLELVLLHVAPEGAHMHMAPGHTL